MSYDLEQFIAVLTKANGLIRHSKTVPTYIPRNWLECFCTYDDEATPTPTLRLYVYINRGWHYVALT